MGDPRYLIVGGVPIDDVVALTGQQQLDFLQVLYRLRRDPVGHPDLDIEKARPLATDDDRRWIARFGSVDVMYVVDDGQRPAIVLLAVLPYDDPDGLLHQEM